MLHVNQLTGFNSAERSKVTFVGSKSATSTGSEIVLGINTGLTGGIRSSVAAGDLVIAMLSSASQGVNFNLSITTGYTLIGSEKYVGSSTYQTNARVAYKVMGTTPDTNVTFGATAGLCGTIGAVYVFSNVDTTTPMDVTAVQADKANSALADPPSITPITPGAIVLAAGFGSMGPTASQTYSSSDLTSFITVYANSTNDSIAGIGLIENWQSGAVNPAAFTCSQSDFTNFSSTAISIAIRPA